MLGKEVLDALVERGLVETHGGTRDVRVTPRGLRELPALVPGWS